MTQFSKISGILGMGLTHISSISPVGHEAWRFHI
jgi:hypothetical protein